MATTASAQEANSNNADLASNNTKLPIGLAPGVSSNEAHTANMPTVSNDDNAVVIKETTLPIYESDPGNLLGMQRVSGHAGVTKPESSSDKKLVTSGIDDTRSVNINYNSALAAKNNVASVNELSAEDKEWIENYALYNRPIPKKWKGKLAWQMYATPSVVYRELNNDGISSTVPNSAPFVIPASDRDINKDVKQRPSVGLEVGAGFKYAIFKGVSLKTGLQLNFTRYNTHAFHNTHPVATKLTMHDPANNNTYELYKTTPYSNKTGLDAVKLHNETYQVSIPIGVDLRILGNENLQWNLGVALQPTLVIGGRAYLISSDRRNFVKENSMINRWNLNTAIETFITYKANGFTWQLGPQFRRQLFSTTDKRFIIQEKLLNYGIKIGVSKNLK